MKKICLIITTILLLYSCDGNKKYDQRIVKDSDNNYYILEHQLGLIYHIKDLDTTQLKDLIKYEK